MLNSIFQSVFGNILPNNRLNRQDNIFKCTYSQLLLLLYLFIVIISCFYFYSLGLFNPNLLDFYSQNTQISMLSFGYYINLCIAACMSSRMWVNFLPLVILTVPNAINDLMPGYTVGKIDDETFATVPFLSHIELYLLLGLNYTKFKNLNSPIKSKIHSLVFWFVILSICSGFLSFFLNHSYIFYKFSNLVQQKYLLLLVLLSPVILGADVRDVRIWVIVSILLVLLESLAYTYATKSPYLTSGNFGTNTLATMLSLAILWLAVSSKRCSVVGLVWAASLIILVSFITDTRSALLSLILSYSIYVFLRANALMKIIIIFGFVIISYYIFYSFEKFFIDLFAFVNYSFDFYEVAVSSLDINSSNSSLLTRLSMWYSSWKLIQDNLLGVGYTGWHYLMTEYGVSLQIFIDPHNDYIFSILNYGIISVVFYFIIIYIVPIININKSQNIENYIPILFVLFSNLSNSNLYKHQFFALYIVLIFIYSFKIGRLSNKFG